MFKLFNPRIKSVARDYYLKKGDVEDLVQEARIGFMDAIKVYDFDKGKKFKNFAYICMKRRIYSIIKNSNRYKNKILNEAISIYEYERKNCKEGKFGTDFEKGLVPGPEEIVLKKEFYNNVSKIADKYLSEFERKILNKRLEGFSYSDIEKNYDTSIKAVDNAVQRIRKKFILHRDEY